MEEQNGAGAVFGAGLGMRTGSVEGAGAKGRYTLTCRDEDGVVKWTEEVGNLVTDEGLNHVLGVTLKGAVVNTAWYIGLKGAGAVAAGDTHAAHAGWAELTAYTEAARPAWAGGAVSAKSVSNSATPARFTASGAMTVAGSFLASNATKGSVAAGAVLYSVGDFAASRAMVANDTLDVTATFTQAAV